MTEINDHTKVAPTAWGVAYLRTFSDIPLTGELFEILDAHAKSVGGADTAGIRNRDLLAPQLEARYKLVDKLLQASGQKQIIELAAGLAPRGLNWANAHPDSRYVETDLPDVIGEKQAVIRDSGLPLPANLSFFEADVLSGAAINNATAAFDKSQPVAVVNEGLMRYLTFDEKTQLAHNVAAVLMEFGGVWITPDISLREALGREDEAAKGHIQSLQQNTGIDLSKNVFDDVQHARNFFEDLGFNVEQRSFLEVSDELASPARLGMSPESVTRLNEPCVAFVMTLKD